MYIPSPPLRIVFNHRRELGRVEAHIKHGGELERNGSSLGRRHSTA